ncbi:MAG: deoxyribonuclease V [bacterium]
MNTESTCPVFASSAQEARGLQEMLRQRVQIVPLPSQVQTVAGVDVSCDKDSKWGVGGVVVCDAETLRVLEQASFHGPLSFPYIPGYLSFRELPLVLPAFERLSQKPDLVICDAQGLAHPRRFGLACHLGVALDCPSIGCAKSLLVGRYKEPGRERGARVPLMFEGEVVGTVLRTRTGVAPVYVSVGHRITLEEATDWILRITPSYRLSEPIRWAHKLVNQIREQRGR